LAATSYFKSNYSQPSNETIRNVLAMETIFPRWIDQEERKCLFRPIEMVEVTQIVKEL
jgi:hypothetical protein